MNLPSEVFPWTCPDHGFLWLGGYGISVAKARRLGGPHQHRCPRCEGWIRCNEWRDPKPCSEEWPGPQLDVSNVPKTNMKEAPA